MHLCLVGNAHTPTHCSIHSEGDEGSYPGIVDIADGLYTQADDAVERDEGWVSISKEVIEHEGPLTVSVSLPKTNRQDSKLSNFMLLACCFLDELGPLAFLVPIIGQAYGVARWRNNFAPLTKLLPYSFFSPAEAPSVKETEIILDWNCAPNL